MPSRGSKTAVASPVRKRAAFRRAGRTQAQHPQLRTLISIGGWEAGGFSDAALSARSRKRFVASCIAVLRRASRQLRWRRHRLGVSRLRRAAELTARPQDRRNMTLLGARVPPPARCARQAARAGVPAHPPRCRPVACIRRVLTIPRAVFELGHAGRELDFINLMTYDMGTAFSAVASFNAPLREDKADPLDPSFRR
jgi:chitinase